jgi:prefoldin subunit 5
MPQPSPTDEIGYLKQQAEFLKQQLEDISRKIKELDKNKK